MLVAPPRPLYFNVYKKGNLEIIPFCNPFPNYGHFEIVEVFPFYTYSGVM